MSPERMPQQVLFGELMPTRPHHGPKKRWRDVLADDLHDADIPQQHWLAMAQDRPAWRRKIFSDRLPPPGSSTHQAVQLRMRTVVPQKWRPQASSAFLPGSSSLLSLPWRWGVTRSQGVCACVCVCLTESFSVCNGLRHTRACTV
eukprot:scpid93204/ scgid6135/ 